MATEATCPQDLVEIEAIKALKYRYVRAVDTRDWELLESLLDPHATAAYASGRLSFEGREAILEFLRSSMPAGELLSVHRVHHPEIELTSADTATALWALDDVVILPAAELTIRGAGYYEDELVKTGGAWKIRHTGYRRTYEETEGRAGVTLTDHWWAGGGGAPQARKPPNPPL